MSVENPDPIAIDPKEICAVFRRLKSQLKTERVYFNGDEPFEMKCDSFVKSSASVLEGNAGENGFTALDRTLRTKNDEPRMIDVRKDDYLVLLDNTKVGLFGGLERKPCQFGCLVTKKGVLTYNSYERDGYRSGFVAWSTVAFVDPSMNSSGKFSLKFFYKRMKEYPNGPRVQFYFDRVGNKDSNSKYFCEAICHLWHLARGIQKPFDYDEYDGDSMGEAD